MPYIPQEDREELGELAAQSGYNATSPGELNYLLTAIIHNYIESKGLSYSTINEVIGVLECAKLELYRMVASPYEEKKRSENGDIGILDE